MEGYEGGGWRRRRWDDNAVCFKQFPDLQQGAVHGGAAAAEQYGEGFRGQGEVQVEHGGQDLVGECEPGRAAAPVVLVRG